MQLSPGAVPFGPQRRGVGWGGRVTTSPTVPFTDAEEALPAEGAGREGQAPTGGPEPASEPKVSSAVGPGGGPGSGNSPPAPTRGGPDLLQSLVYTELTVWATRALPSHFVLLNFLQ